MAKARSIAELDRERTIPRFVPPENPAATEVALATATVNRETRHDKFVRLGNRRTKEVIRALRKLARLGTPGYERHEDEIDKVSTILVAELQTTLTKLRTGIEPAIEDIL